MLTPGNFFEEGGFRDRGDRQKYYVGETPQEYILNKYDLLLVMTEQAPGLLGSPLIVPESQRYLHNQRLGLVIAKEPIQVSFLFHLCNQKSIRQIIHAKATGTKVRHTSPTKIESIVVGYPPNSLQIQFDQIVEKVDALKVFYQESLKEIENLYGSLSQRAFKGELDLSNVEVPEELPVVEKKEKEEVVEKKGQELKWPEYANSIIRDNLNGRFSYEELKGAINKLQNERKAASEKISLQKDPTSKEIRELLLKMLEDKPPYIEQIFDIPASEIDKPTNEQKKQIIFRVIDENKKS